MTHDEARAAAERLSHRKLEDYQGPTGDDADMRAAIALARFVLDLTDPTPVQERDQLWRDAVASVSDKPYQRSDFAKAIARQTCADILAEVADWLRTAAN